MWSGGLIDFHHHGIPPALTKELADSLGAGGESGLRMPAWSKDGMLSFMDENRIGTAISSVAVNVSSTDTAGTVKKVRECNDFLAGLVRDRPDRFGGFGLLPLPFVQESIAEIDRVLDDIGLDGVLLSTNYTGRYLGDPAFDAVLRRWSAVALSYLCTPLPPRTPSRTPLASLTSSWTTSPTPRGQ